MRTQTYIFLQKLRCPKCNRILAGGATHKIKADKWYFYYRCENCKNNIKEEVIEESIKNTLSDILEYDNVVNEFFLPMLKNNNEKDKEIISLKNKIFSLSNTIEYWKNRFEKLIYFLHSKIHNWFDRDDKYIEVINDMYQDIVLDDEDINDLELGKNEENLEI